MPIYRLENTIKNYIWGSHDAISGLLGKDFSSLLPQAEIWMGAHSKAPSSVLIDGGKCSLNELIISNPVEVLGEQTFRKFGRELPYLLKVLAVDKPLSVQVHPNKKQALSGYNKENYEEKPINCYKRNYKDKNHKVECMCALTSLWSLNGFRSIPEIQLLIGKICPDSLSKFFRAFILEPNFLGLEKFLRSLALLPKKEIKIIVSQALLKAERLVRYSLVFEWICRLAELYPNDINIFAPVVLNLIKLEPNEAIFVPEGVLHTYMKGMGVEIMVNSDNVLRGGLTNKHTDIPELLDIIDFRYNPVSTVDTVLVTPCEVQYQIDVIEFLLSVVSVSSGQVYLAPRDRSLEILLCTDGEAIVIDVFSGSTIKIKKGDSFLVTASVLQYSIHGEATMFKAGIPLSR